MCQWLVENGKCTSQSIYYMYFINTIGLETASWENFRKSSEQTKNIKGSFYSHLSAFTSGTKIPPETKQHTCIPPNNQIVKSRHIFRDTELNMPNLLVTSKPPNAKHDSSFHSSGVKVLAIGRVLSASFVFLYFSSVL